MDKGYKFGVVLMLLSSCCVCAGQLFWKLSADDTIPYLCIGFLLYGTGFMAMLNAYKYGSVSKLQPVLSISYVFAVLLGFYVLGEGITVNKIIGIIIIIVSVVLIGSSAD